MADMPYDSTGNEVTREGHEDTGIVPADERGERFAQLIRNARRDAGLSQDDVASQTGISRSQLIRWESGKAERPDPPTVRAVCLFLGVDPREAAIALGYLTRDEAYGQAPKPIDPMIREVLDLLEDAKLPQAEVANWIAYLQFLHQRHDQIHRKAMHEARATTRRALEAQRMAKEAQRAAARQAVRSTKTTKNPRTTTMAATKKATTGRFVKGGGGSSSSRSTKPPLEKDKPPLEK